MLQSLYESDIVTLNYSAKNKLVEVIWKKNTNSDEYRKMFGIIVEFSAKNQIRYVLSDMRNEGLVGLDDVRWLHKEVLNRAIEQKLERIALVIEESIFCNVYSDVVKKKLEKSPISVRIFQDNDVARAWLLGE